MLRTGLAGEGGRLLITDSMPLLGAIGGRGTAEPAHEIHRILHCEEGEVEVEIEWSPRFDYARARTRMREVDGGFVAESGDSRLVLRGIPPGAVGIAEEEFGPALRARFRMRAGDRLPLACGFGALRHASGSEVLRASDRTLRSWREWVHTCDPEAGCAFAGPVHRDAVRSALVLKLLTHSHTGAIAAAATTSLPEEIGGVRNWDYRFTWLRDASFVSQALYSLGHRLEARQFLEWVSRVSEASGEDGYDPQIMYGLHGERELPEIELPHLEGYRGSRPVRVGNAAARQLQLDVYGEVIGAAYEMVRQGGRLSPRLWEFLAAMADEACWRWREPDHGIWEVRQAPRHFVYSKVMAWVALDRAVRMAERMRLPGRVRRWRMERAAIQRAVLSEGYDPRLRSFVRSFGSTALDAANLLVPMMEFLPADDPRVQGTIDRTLAGLLEEGMVRRYRTDDGLPGGEGAFVLCTFWLVDALTLAGRTEEAREIFQAMASRRSHLGLLPEEIDPRSNTFLGNFPQAFSHSGFVNSALYLARAEGRRAPGLAPIGSRRHRGETGHSPEAAV